MRHGYGVNKKSALVVGYFGYGNMGDDKALTIAIKIMCDMGITPYVAFSSEGDWGIFEGYGAIRVDSKSGKAMLAAINTCDGVFFLGGNHFENESSRRSLLYYSAVALAAAKRGKPVYMIASGIGRMKRGTDRQIALRALSRLSHAGLRTEGDLVQASRILSCPAVKMPDLAFCSELLKEEKTDSFAIIPRQDSAALLVHARRLVALGLKPVVIPFFIHEDMRAARGYGEALSCEVFFSKSAEEIRRRISTMQVTLSERLHGGIFSLTASTPFMFISKSQKCRRFSAEAGEVARLLGSTSPSLDETFGTREFQVRDKCDFAGITARLKGELLSSLHKMLWNFAYN